MSADSAAGTGARASVAVRRARSTPTAVAAISVSVAANINGCRGRPGNRAHHDRLAVSNRPASAALAIRRAGSFAVHARHASSTARSAPVSFRPNSGARISGAPPSDQRG
ncbi:MAG TPA: hypothetical protein VN903_07290, partial [Polyangia bacterium]|nr:hypothetical protein [Polyangia bacterium]